MIFGETLTDVDLLELIEEEKVIKLDQRPRAVFVGDTHGDFDASQRVWRLFGRQVENGDAYLVFLGDYVDRGLRSKENIDFLISKKAENPTGVILLLGNHEAYHILEAWPNDFWTSLSREEYEYYKNLAYLPWIVESGDLIAAHGALPFVSDLGKLTGPRDELFEKKNDFGLPIWFSVTWGDLNPEVDRVSTDPFTGRPQFGEKVFLEYMEKYGKNILIRSHQPLAERWMFKGRALTVFTSDVYVNRTGDRVIAEVKLSRKVGRDDIRVFRLE